MSLNTETHTHYCASCEQRVDCRTAREGGCLFTSKAAATCDRCAERLFGSGNPEDGEHRCQCVAPDPPDEGARCTRCGRWVVMFDAGRVFDLGRLGT